MTEVVTSERTVLFDLDGTLLFLDADSFFGDYMKSLFKHFEHMMLWDEFQRNLMAATYETIDNLNTELGNLEAFKMAFIKRTGLCWDEIYPFIDGYYREEYPLLQKHVSFNQVPKEVVEKCIKNGWRIVMATQPLLPEVATRERMRWCGIDSLPWTLITNLDNMHFCKPHIEYYTEIVERAKLDPSRSVMVGNDMQEDMVAKSLGMKTILVKDVVIDRGEDLEPDLRCKLVEVPEMLEQLLPVIS